MKKEGYYSSGQFASLAQVTLRTIRFYDQKGLLKPSFVTESGARFYTDDDLVKLQQILLLKYLGFSLEEIKELIVNDADPHLLMNSLSIQRKLIKDKIEQMQRVDLALEEAVSAIQAHHRVEWNQMLNLIHLTADEKNLKSHYQDASNLSSRIQLHEKYSLNPQGWFPWLFEQLELKACLKVLEVGCGDGRLWQLNSHLVPKGIDVVLSDASEGMVRDANRQINRKEFAFRVFECETIPFEANTFDVVIANHVLFYCENITNAVSDIHRVLKPGGRLICSTYGYLHMKQVTDLVNEFDERINLSSNPLVERFGKENGKKILQSHFKSVQWKEYDDDLYVTSPEALISYILSCHGNQNDILIPKYKEFSDYVRLKTKKGFKITKEAGIFIAKK